MWSDISLRWTRLTRAVGMTIGVTAAASCAAARPRDARDPEPSVAANDTAAVRALDSVWARNYATNDTASADQLMAADFFMTSGTGTVKTKAMEMRDIRPAPGGRTPYFRTESPHVHVYGSVAIVTGFAAWAYEQGGASASYRRKYTAVYTRGGPLGWRLQELHMSPS